MVQQTNITNKILMLIAMVWLGSGKVMGQWPFPWLSGYHNSSVPNVIQLDRDTIINEGETYYTDIDRAQVQSCAPLTFNSNRIVITANANNRHGIFKSHTNFFNQNIVNGISLRYRYFVMQMRTTNPNSFGEHNSGLCFEVSMLSVDTTSGQLICNVFAESASLQFLDSIGNAVIQIVRIPSFKNFTLNGGVVTCSPYDGHTGGVIAMRAFFLRLKSGYFNAAAKGYFPENVSWGQPSTGAMGDITHNNTSTNNIDRKYKRICPDSNGLNLLEGFYGTGGDPAVPNFSNGTTSNGTRLYYGRQHTQPVNVFPIMGSAGYFIAGQKAGNGAEGGGHGGTGGGSQNGNNGFGGDIGSNGEAGGAVGKGGRGGGIIMLKIASVTWLAGHIYNNPSSKLFYVNGKNGGYGGNGGKGGDGGIGGQGANGSIVGNTIFYRGGIGTSGAGGAGGTGGDGSNGGDPGCLSLYMQNFLNHPSGVGNATLSTLKTLTDLRAGKGGYGGQGGFKGRSQEQIQQNDPSPLPNNKQWCGGSSSTNITPTMKHICNCDSVFWALSIGNAFSVGGNGTAALPYHYDFNTGLHQFDVKVKKDTGEVHLWSLRKGTYITNHCYLRKSRDCDPMVDKIKGTPIQLLGGGFVDLISVPAVRTSTNPLVVVFKKGSNLPYTDAFEWIGGTEGILTDIIQPANPICYKGNCNGNNPLSRAEQSTEGNMQNDGDSAILDENSDNSGNNNSFDEQNIGLFTERAMPPPQNDDNHKGRGELADLGIATQVDKFTIILPQTNIATPIETINYQIMNSLGQVLSKGKVNAANQWQISTANMASGVYTLNLFTNNGNFVHKFVKVN